MDARKLLPNDSFFLKYLDCFPLAEPPKSYQLFSAMAMFGIALGRRVYVDMDIHRTYPMLNLLLIGPSGIGKSTSLVDMALESLINPLPPSLRPQVITGKSTKEALHEDLMMNPHAIVVASELANMFSREKYNEGQIPYFTDLLDLRPTRVRTRSGGERIVEEPTVAVCGGSTKEWLQDQLPSTAAAGGFLPRFFIVKEDHKYQRVADPSAMLTAKQKIELAHRRSAMVTAFKHLVDVEHGRVDFADYDARDTYGLWYQCFTPDTGALAPFAARAGVHVTRLSLLLALSCGRKEITKEDIKCAIKLFDFSQKKLAEVVIPMSPMGKLQAKVLDIVGDDYMSDTMIKRAMRNHCTSQDTERLLQSLLQSKDLVVVDGKYKRSN